MDSMENVACLCIFLCVTSRLNVLCRASWYVQVNDNTSKSNHSDEEVIASLFIGVCVCVFVFGGDGGILKTLFGQSLSFPV